MFSPYRQDRFGSAASSLSTSVAGTLKTMSASTETVAQNPAETDVISLTLPGAVRFVRLARIGVASLARRKGMSVRSIDDLRLAMDETFLLLLGEQDHAGSVDVTFEVDEHELAVLVVQRLTNGPVLVSDEERVRFDVVLTDLVDRVEADVELGVVQFSKLL